ncbi:uncharacterized protein si:dkey-163f14.6 [Acanthochromis polyacanthus]|uniref:uncharacterized protein si:dkey-163f14.6 n=1 Tax=Acanthochromis polyacanthus TaxID=80966 RepID=UPI000B900EA9|nr:uncharacterized protein si:dkey-163f14.6 [Acanthochromis polyacanthus]
MGLLSAALTLVCIFAPVCGAERCGGFRRLENGQTFFRYGGLLVIFRCHPGFKLHGYKTNSCVSGHWSREPAVCVGSGCSNPGPLSHGTSSMNEDGSWAVFSCNNGFRLHGPSMLYCKGHTWNSTKPVCKEFDMMSSISGVAVQKSHHNLQVSAALKSQQHSHYLTNTPSKEADLKFGLSSRTPSQINMTNPKAHLQKHIQLPNLKAKNGGQTAHCKTQAANEAQEAEGGTVRAGSEAGKVEEVTQMFASESGLFTTVSSAISSVSGTEKSTSSPSFSTAATAFADTTVDETTLPLSGFRISSQDEVTPSEGTTTDKYQQVESGSQHHFLSHSWPVDKEEPAETSNTSFTSVYSTSASFSSPPSPATSTSSVPSSTWSHMKTHPPNVTSPLNISATDSSSYWTEYYNLRMNTTSRPLLILSRRPVCPYPPVPAHGTFYFRSVENPGPREYRHYIQYACYPGYTLAYGDVHSYCQQGGRWSGVTPVCLESTPCSVNNGGCSQLCSHSQHHNQSSNQNQNRTQCLCRQGFTLLDDGRTCRDVDECVEEQHQCQQGCINTFGSFKCSCDDGYHPAHDQTSCTDVDECLLPAAVTGCVFGCVNTPGSFHCQCPAGYSLRTADGRCQDVDECAVNQGLGPCMERCHNSPGSYRCSCTYGHILAGDGRSCVSECPPGYRTQPTTPENSATQTVKQECVDINECQEEICEGQCINLPGSHRCICPKGFALQRDGRRCRDINECNRKNGGCSHVCVNQRGGYKCACPASHRLSPYSWKKCVPRTTATTAG